MEGLTMRRKFAAMVVMTALAVSACGNDGAQDVAVCANRITGEVLPDSACTDYNGGAFPEWMAYMYVSQAIFNAHYGVFQPGHVISHTEINTYNTTYAAPASNTRVATRDGTVRKATVYTQQQAGKPVKFNQDAKKVSTVVGSKSYKPAKVNNTTYKSQGQKADNKLKSWGMSTKPSSYGTASSYKPARTGKCC